VYKHILVAVDHSDVDGLILEHIKSLGRICHSKITLIHVADGFGARYQKALDLADSREIVDDRRYLEELKADFASDGFEVNTHLASGDPAKEILNFADRSHCDLIAMSTHGHGPVADFFLGSVAASVRHKTALPVLLIRKP
jgi:nucleotide-binding universal stress UspA family protein